MNNQSGWIYTRNEREKQKERLRQLEQVKQRYLEELLPLPQRSAPHPWEDVASLLSRVARKMGYEHPEWLLRPENAPHKISPANLPLLHGQHDYHLLERLLLLDEEQLYALTVHRFAPHFTRQPRPFSVMNGEMQQPVKRAGLQYEYIRQFFSDERHCRICPRCLDEGNGYDRLYWRCELLLYCPRHRVFLVHRCPACHAPIPALRLSLTCCPACQTGDYRTHIFPLLPEDGWLERVHITLLRNLGIDGPEEGEQIAHGSKTALDGLPSWDYFRVLLTCASFFKPLDRSGVDTFRSFIRTLPPETLISRLSKNVGISSYKLLPSIFAHYLSSDWPYHILVFIERLQRLLQEEFHYAPTSAVVHNWSQMMVQGNYWCVQSYREQPVSQLIDLLDTYMKRFESLPTAETAEDHHGGIIVNERLVLESELQIKTLGKALLPFSWENLPSLLARVADRMGYRRTEEIWHSPSGSMRRYRLSPSEILLLQRSDDYRFMEETLLLEKDILYTLTLHRFASALQPPTFKDPLPRQNALWNTVERQLLLMETVSRFCLPSLTTRVCPACLEEKYVYERLYWNIRPVLICPHHHLFLVDRCPKCHWLIPAIRRTALWECSYCNRGDYRSAKRTTLSHDSLQYQSQLMFLHELGVDEPLSKNIPSLFQNSSLKSLQPWEYFDVFNCFGSVAPYLRPERTLTSLCRLFGLPDESSLSQGLEHHRTALQISLFHALFVSWPDHVYETLYGAFSLSHSKHQDRDLHLLDEQNEHLSATLKHLFLEAQTIYAQQAFQRNVMRAGNQRKTE